MCNTDTLYTYKWLIYNSIYYYEITQRRRNTFSNMFQLIDKVLKKQ